MKIDLTPAECEKILTSQPYAHLGCCDGDEPYVVPITYVYENGFLYSYTQEGKKIDILKKNPKICVQVERVESGFAWESVVCWGLFEEVTDAKYIQEIKLSLAGQHGKALLEKGTPPVSPMVKNLHEQAVNEIKRSIIYRIKPYKMTGKKEQE